MILILVEAKREVKQYCLKDSCIERKAVASGQQRQAIRSHWQIENQLHHVRNVALQADACQTRSQAGMLPRFIAIR
jgi:predicted transposase YbfD/YdcC